MGLRATHWAKNTKGATSCHGLFLIWGKSAFVTCSSQHTGSHGSKRKYFCQWNEPIPQKLPRVPSVLLPLFHLLKVKLGSLQAEALLSEVPNARRCRTLPVIVIRKTERSSCLHNPFMLDIGGVSGSPECGNPKFVRGARSKLNFQTRMKFP